MVDDDVSTPTHLTLVGSELYETRFSGKRGSARKATGLASRVTVVWRVILVVDAAYLRRGYHFGACEYGT